MDTFSRIQHSSDADHPLLVGRFRILRLTGERMIRYFFNGNAVIAGLVLALIVIFLFREGVGFFPQNLRNLRLYRLAGLEYVDYIRGELDEHTALSREVSRARLVQYHDLVVAGKSEQQIQAALAAFDAFAASFGDASDEIRAMVSDLSDEVAAVKEKAQTNFDVAEQKRRLVGADRLADAARINITPVDFAAESAILKRSLVAFHAANHQFAMKLEEALVVAAGIPEPKIQASVREINRRTRSLIKSFPIVERQMADWRYDAPVPAWQAITSFLFGRQWVTASFWQDWFGILPLFAGSLLVSMIALALAVPLAIAAAIYVSEISGAGEKRFIKPYIEFVAAIPSVVLGFFGIVVLGPALRDFSQLPWLSWVPGFPMSERLNALTAGCLLAVISVPTIFSLAEDALHNVPQHFRESSYALGADRFQTIFLILVPASLSGLLSAVLLGFGRVIGETMIVLLCAGNRIAIPDFRLGFGAIVQPVHTMTGIIAQEMGEVAPGSIHYRALFMVGVMLFLSSLAINYVAQRLVHRYRIFIG